MLFGYLIRLGLIFLAVWLVKDAAWISLPALGATIIVTHLGLLVWELKYVALSLAHPGLKPARPSHIALTTGTDTSCSDSSSRRSTPSCVGRTSSRRSTRSPSSPSSAALIGIVDLPARRQPRRPKVAPTGVRNLAEIIVEFIEDQVVMQTMGKAGLRLDAVPAQPVHLHLPLQRPGHHPDHPDAGDGPHRHPAVPRAARVGDLHRRRLQAPGPRLLRPPAVAARACRRR